MEGSVCGLIEVLSRTLRGETKEIHEKPDRIAGGLVEIQTEHLPTASLEQVSVGMATQSTQLL
jgi:hypothetical protein